MRIFYLIALCLAVATPLFAHEQHGNTASPRSAYAGEQIREIASLSREDIAELQRGGGWGLARAAELNGVPGPAHLLELKAEIGLSTSQVAAISAIRDRMRADAISAGGQLIAAERALDHAFTNTIPDAAELARLVTDAGKARAALRLVHLSAHLDTPAILSPTQIERYDVLRGYADDPCAAVPEGHDPAMWRRHNGCK